MPLPLPDRNVHEQRTSPQGIPLFTRFSPQREKGRTPTKKLASCPASPPLICSSFATILSHERCTRKRTEALQRPKSVSPCSTANASSWPMITLEPTVNARMPRGWERSNGSSAVLPSSHKEYSFRKFQTHYSSKEMTLLPLITSSNCDWKPYYLFGFLHLQWMYMLWNQKSNIY